MRSKMQRLRESLQDFLGLFSKLRDASLAVGGTCRGPRPKPTPELVRLDREASISSARRSFGHRRSTKRRRIAEEPPSLLHLSVAAICAHVASFSPDDFNRLAPDLLQAVLDELIAGGVLNESNVWLYRGQHVFHLSLGGYPGVQNSWLRAFWTSPLREVDLSRCKEVDDHGLSHLRHQTQLVKLCLEECHAVTDTGLSYLSGMTRLKLLNLKGCDKIGNAGVSALAGLVELEFLSLELCRQVCQLHFLHALAKLVHLNLGWCHGITSDNMASLADKTNLTDLQLSRTQVDDGGMNAVGAMMQLQRLGLAGTEVTDTGLAWLFGLTQLQDISLDWCPCVGDAGMHHLSGLTGLTSVTASYTAVSDAGLRALQPLTRLRTLNLDSCQLTGGGLSTFTALTAVEHLNLSDNVAVRDVGTVHLACLRRLKSLNLSYTGVSDVGLTHISKLADLTDLNLDSRMITDAGLAHISGLTNLESLDLFGAKVTDIGCAHLRPLKRLQSLESCGGGITDAGLAHIAELPALTSLSLAQNARIGNAGLPALVAGLPGLRHLNLAHSRVSSSGAQHLSALTELVSLSLCNTRVRRSAVEKLRVALPCLQTLCTAA